LNCTQQTGGDIQQPDAFPSFSGMFTNLKASCFRLSSAVRCAEMNVLLPSIKQIINNSKGALFAQHVWKLDAYLKGHTNLQRYC
jgi:hypothetical protein